jgi:pseudouridine-5'-phosphate glycosidase
MLETRRVPVVALESSLIAQGLPVPHNLETALAAEAAIRESGAVPATTALEDGRLVVGADRALLERLADPERVIAKAGSRDLGPLLASDALAATTVSATMRAAHLAGIAVFATGGIGGVHRGASSSFDVSSDIAELAGTPVAVVSSGAKSILDLPATLEMLETRRVPVVGYGVDQLPAFYSISSGLSLSHRVDGPAEAAAAIAAHRSIPAPAACSSSSHRPPTWRSTRPKSTPGSRRRSRMPQPAGCPAERSRHTCCRSLPARRVVGPCA